MMRHCLRFSASNIDVCVISDLRLAVNVNAAGYGQESASRVQRQQIPHQIYKDANGLEHVRVSSC